MRWGEDWVIIIDLGLSQFNQHHILDVLFYFFKSSLCVSPILKWLGGNGKSWWIPETVTMGEPIRSKTVMHNEGTIFWVPPWLRNPPDEILMRFYGGLSVATVDLPEVSHFGTCCQFDCFSSTIHRKTQGVRSYDPTGMLHQRLPNDWWVCWFVDRYREQERGESKREANEFFHMYFPFFGTLL